MELKSMPVSGVDRTNEAFAGSDALALCKRKPSAYESGRLLPCSSMAT